MSYGDTKDKREGILKEKETIQKFLKELIKVNYKVLSCVKSSKDEDMNDKIDWHIKFDESTPFFGKTEILVDGKYGNTVTVINETGENSVEFSKSDYYYFWDHKYSGNTYLYASKDVKEYVSKKMNNLKMNLDGKPSYWLGVAHPYNKTNIILEDK